MSDTRAEPSLAAVAAMVSVGFIPLNLLPFTVVGYASGLHLDGVDAGILGTIEMSGAMLGSLASIPLVRRGSLGRLAAFATLAAVVCELLSCAMHSFAGMGVARAFVGVACGMVFACGNAIAASVHDPARYYMRVLALQSAFTIFIWSAMPKLLSVGNQIGVFIGAAIALLALASVMVLSGPRGSAAASRRVMSRMTDQSIGPAVVVMALLAVFSCCMRDGVVWTFSDRIAIEVGLSNFGQTWLFAGIAAIGLVGLLASSRLDIWKRPVVNVVVAITFATATTTGLLFSHYWPMFVALALPWAAVQFLALSLLTGLAAELDSSGRLSAAIGAAFHCAYAVAPALAGFVYVRYGLGAVGGVATLLGTITVISGAWLAGRAAVHRRTAASASFV